MSQHPTAAASTSTTAITKTPPQPTTTAILPTPPKPLPFHKLTPEAIQQRRRDGLCFRCPARYFPGHLCSPPQFLFIVDHGELDDTDIQQPTFTDMTPPEFMTLSPASFLGMSSPQTLRLTGYISGSPVTVLIDCGSTHNIMQPRIASLLSVSSVPSPPFPVMVGNGQYILCEGHCPAVPVTLDNASFDIAFYIFPIRGTDIVLGIAWLATLGPLRADFAIPEISFPHHQRTVLLRGDPATPAIHRSLPTPTVTPATTPTLHTILAPPLPPLPTTAPPHVVRPLH